MAKTDWHNNTGLVIGVFLGLMMLAFVFSVFIPSWVTFIPITLAFGFVIYWVQTYK